MELSQADREVINRFNEHASEVTDATLTANLEPWFSNIRELVRANFHLQDIAELGTHALRLAKYFVILGSGPSAPKILRDLPLSRDIALICGPTAVSSCLVAGRTPDLVFVADSKPEQYTVIRDLEPEDPSLWRIALPITADPQWYAEDSIFGRHQLYFYINYLNHEGSVDFAYNHIMKILCPDVIHYLSQAGCVGNAALTFADMLCGKDASKRIYLGLDCCGWLTNPPQLRAPDALKKSDGSYAPVTTFRQVKQNEEDSENALRLSLPSFDIQTNATSLGYAIQMLYLAYSQSVGPLSHRYNLIEESSALYSYANKHDGLEVIVPAIKASEIGLSVEPFAEDDWAYKLLVKLSRLLVSYRDHIASLAKEVADASEEDIANEHSEG